MAKNASVSSGSGLIRETVSMTDSFQYVRPAGGVRSTAGETVKLMSRPTTGATGRPTWNDTYVLPVDDQRTSSASQSPFLPAVAPQVRTEVLPLWGLYRVSWKDPWHFSCSLSKCCGILTVENNFIRFSLWQWKTFSLPFTLWTDARLEAVLSLNSVEFRNDFYTIRLQIEKVKVGLYAYSAPVCWTLHLRSWVAPPIQNVEFENTLFLFWLRETITKIRSFTDG